MEDSNLLREIQEDYRKAKETPKKKGRKTKADLEKEKLERIKSIKKKILYISLAVVTAVTGVAYAAERYVDWRAEHEWQFPARWIGMVRRIERPTAKELVESGQVRQLTDVEVIEQYYLSPVLKSLYLLESTSGKNDACKDSGKYNGFGFRQHDTENKCYDGFEEVVEEVNEWLEIRLASNGNNLTEAICYYNTGVPYKSTCGDYSENFWSVISKYF